MSDAVSFKDAIKILDRNGNGFLAVTDKINKLLGVLTDGDIRRAILDNKTELKDIINKNPVFMNIKESRQSIVYELKKIHRKHMPLVDDNMILKDIIVLDEEDFNLKPNWVIIMAGGLGSRLGDLTKNTPKPMLRVGGKPMIEHIINMFKSHGFTNFILSVNYKSEVIKEHFKDGKKFGIRVKYIEEEKRLGTGGALSLINFKLNESFFVTNGDVLSSLNCDEILDFHNANKAHATMCIRKDSYQIPYGVIEVGDDNNIIDIVEKPVKEFHINTGIYVLHPDSLKHIPKDKFFDLPNLFDILKKSDKVIKSHEINNYWVDMGSPGDYEKINRDLKGK